MLLLLLGRRLGCRVEILGAGLHCHRVRSVLGHPLRDHVLLLRHARVIIRERHHLLSLLGRYSSHLPQHTTSESVHAMGEEDRTRRMGRSQRTTAGWERAALAAAGYVVVISDFFPALSSSSSLSSSLSFLGATPIT
jgi:hypothetical protein